MLVEVAGFIGVKLIDKIFEGALDATIDKFTKEKIVHEYTKIKKKIYENLLTDTVDESYFENLQRLLDESTIIDIIFNFSFLFSNLSDVERKKFIEEYVLQFFEEKNRLEKF